MLKDVWSPEHGFKDINLLYSSFVFLKLYLLNPSLFLTFATFFYPHLSHSLAFDSLLSLTMTSNLESHLCSVSLCPTVT